MRTDSQPQQGLPDPIERPTVSVEEAAAWLGVGRGAAYAAVKNGTLPAIRVGQTKLRVPTAALLRLLGQDDRTPVA